MLRSIWRAGLPLAIASLPVCLYAFSRGSGPPVLRTAVPADGGSDCTGCHRTFVPANSDPAGSVRLEVINYVLGQKQRIRVTVAHPLASKWGFQLTARLASDPKKSIGTFTGNENVQVVCEDLQNAGNIRGVPGPCTGGAREFVQHTEAGTRPGTAGSATFEVDWTPPATDAGDVIFYVAGNAANNSGSPAGDRIYTTSRMVTTCQSKEDPKITAIVEATGTNRTPTAINGLITIWGEGFARENEVRLTDRTDFEDGRFPSALGCVAVEIGNVRAPVLAAGEHQLNVQVPTVLAYGTTPVRVIYNPGDASAQRVSNSAAVTVQNYAPSLFTFDGKVAAAKIAGTAIPVWPGQGGGRGAKPGEVVELYATGLSVSEPVFKAGELAPGGEVPVRDPVTVTLAGTTLRKGEDLLYVGLAPTLISGLYQINIKVPETLADGDYPVVVQMGSASSQSGVILPVRR